MEAAIPSALSSGSFFFADIQNNQVDAAGRSVLQLIAVRLEPDRYVETMIAALREQYNNTPNENPELET